MSRGLPCCGNVECKCDDQGRSPDHLNYKQSPLDKNEHKYEVSQEFQDWWAERCDEPHKALMEKMQAWGAWKESEIRTLAKSNIQVVKSKSMDELKKMVRNKEIDLVHVSDDGEMYAYGTKSNPTHVLHLWYHDHDQEYLVVDHPHIISKQAYEARKLFFKPKV